MAYGKHNTKNTQQRETTPPALIAWHVSERGEKKFWNRICAAWEHEDGEAEKLWNTYKADRKDVNDRYQPFIDAIWKSRRTRPPHPYTEQALRDIEESAEWKALGRTQFAQR